MITIVDRPKLKNRAMLSNLASSGGLVLLLASVLLPLFLPKWAKFSFVMMAVGLGTAMVGIYFANRWVRRPRPEDRLDQALKPLNDSHHLFHYPALPCDHVLLTPNGVVLLETVNLGGEFYYQNQRWKEAMTMGRAIRFIVEEHLGDPIRSVRQTENYLRERLHQGARLRSLPSPSNRSWSLSTRAHTWRWKKPRSRFARWTNCASRSSSRGRSLTRRFMTAWMGSSGQPRWGNSG